MFPGREPREAIHIINKINFDHEEMQSDQRYHGAQQDDPDVYEEEEEDYHT